MWNIEEEIQGECEKPNHSDQPEVENQTNEVVDNNDDHVEEDPKWWEGESQNLLDSEQLVEGLSLCDDLLQSQSPSRNGTSERKARLADYAKLGPEDWKKDLEECQTLVLDPANIELDTPPEFRLSQLVSIFSIHPFFFSFLFYLFKISPFCNYYYHY